MSPEGNHLTSHCSVSDQSDEITDWYAHKKYTSKLQFSGLIEVTVIIIVQMQNFIK